MLEAINFEKIKEKHGFTAADMLMCLASLIAIIVLVLPIILKQSSSHAHNEAMYRARSLSNELVSKIQDMQQPTGMRKPASKSGAFKPEGIVGIDPWGNPYHYRVLKDVYGQPTHLVVWSWGSNAKEETQNIEFGASKGEVRFQGDDLGYITSLIWR
tara:strand:+ start:17769 stop:18239 length:471 start_codon:yes stop_codon:yes gene_type:complete